MSVEDLARYHRLEQRLVEVLGTEEAATLIDRLARGEPATKADLDVLAHRIGGLDQRMDGLDERMDLLRDSLHDLRDLLVARVDASAQTVQGRLEATLHRELGAVRTDLAAQTRTFVLSQLGMLITLAALAFTALRIT